MSKKPHNKKHASSATLPQSINPNQTAAAPFSTPQKIGKFFLVFFLCVAGFALLQRLGRFFGLFTQLSNRFKKAWAQVNSTVSSEAPTHMALTTQAPLATDLATAAVTNTQESVIQTADTQITRKLTGPSGTEFQINTNTTSDQKGAAIASLNDGGFVVVWHSDGQDGSSWGVYGQRYDAQGTTIGGEFQVNSYVSSHQNAPSISSLDSGGFVVVWHSDGQDGSSWGVFSQRYNATGSVVSSEFQVNTYTSNSQEYPAIASLDDGGIVVVWHSEGQDGSDYGVYGQRYSYSGNTVDSEFQVNTYTTNSQSSPTIASLYDPANERISDFFVVVWQSDGQDGSQYGVYGQRYHVDDGTVGSEFQVNTYTTGDQSSPRIATLAIGGFVVVWHSDGQDGSSWGVYGQRYDASGATVSSEFRVNTYTTSHQQYPSITSLADGGFVVVWQSDGQDSSGWGVYGQRYDLSGGTVGSEFRINTYTSSDQQYLSITGLNDGGFVVAWESDGQDGDGFGAYGQRYNAGGQAIALVIPDPTSIPSVIPTSIPTISSSPTSIPTSVPSKPESTTEFQVNTNTTSNQQGADIAHLNDGGFVVVWQSDGQDGSSWGVYGQRYDALGMTVGSEFQVNTYTTSYQWYPSVESLTDGGFVVVWMSYQQDGSDYGVYGQRYDATGAAIGSEFQVNTYTANNQWYPSITSLADGGFMVVWHSDGQDGSSFGVYGQRYDSSGSTVGSEFRVNTYTTNAQSYPSIAGLSDGGFVVAWESDGQDGDGYGIFGQQYDSFGRSITRQPTSLPSAAPSGQPSGLPSSLPSGAPSAHPSSQPSSGPTSLPTSVPSKPDSVTEFQINTYTTSDQQGAAIAHLNDGGFVVVWHSLGQDGSSWGVFGQRYDATGGTVGSEFQVNTYTTSDQSRPDIAGLDDGGFVVVWQSDGQDGDSYGVYGQRYNAIGAIIGSEFKVNTYTTGYQVRPNVARLFDSGFVVVWMSNGQDGSSDGVYGQRYNATVAMTGTEFQVNTYTTSNQRYPKITSLSDGGFVVVWQSDTQDGSSVGVYGQHYNSTGAMVGREFQVNTYVSNHQIRPSIASLVDGFVVVWMSNGQDGSGYGVYGQRYNVTGLTVGNEFQVNSYTTGAQEYPNIASLADGGFVVVWHSNGQDGSAWGVYGQRYDSSGAIVGSEFQVNTYALIHQQNPSIAGLDGGFVVAWESNGQDGDGYGIFGQQYDSFGRSITRQPTSLPSAAPSGQPSGLPSSLPSGAPSALPSSQPSSGPTSLPTSVPSKPDSVTEFQINTYTTSDQRGPAIAHLTDGGFVVVWHSNGQDGSSWGVYGQRYDALGAIIGSEFQVNTYTTNDQSRPAITSLTDGGFMVVWHSFGQDGSLYGVYGQRYDSSGGAVGSEFRINTYTLNNQYYPSIAGLSDGGFVIVWHSALQDGSSYGVYGQRYDALGTTLGSEFRVNTYTTSEQSWPDIASLIDGGFVVVWMSDGQDGSNYGVFGQRYNATAATLGNEFQVNTYTTNSQSYTSIASLVDGGFVVVWSSYGQDGSEWGVFGQRYNSTGAMVGSEFQVNTYTSGIQSLPSTASLDDGGFVVVWQSNVQDGSFWGVYGQRYDAAGIIVGSEFRVNTYTANYQWHPAIASLDDGGFVVAWESGGQDGNGFGIFGQQYDSFGRSITRQPTSLPSSEPSGAPSAVPSGRPSGSPSSQPSAGPSSLPSSQPSGEPSGEPSGLPSGLPSSEPSGEPSGIPSGKPSGLPSSQPSSQPSGMPSSRPSSKPSGLPSGQPSACPSGQPSGSPSAYPSSFPSSQPSAGPSSLPSSEPSGKPSSEPSGLPSSSPSGEPSSQPSSRPSSEPSGIPSGEPSGLPSSQPSSQPSGAPSSPPSSKPSVFPSSAPSSNPSAYPSSKPSGEPSGLPSSHPSGEPSGLPSGLPSGEPSGEPSAYPSGHPSSQPSSRPSSEPSGIPSGKPSAYPSS